MTRSESLLTYRYRLTFFVHQNGILNCDANRMEFELEGTQKTVIIPCDAKSISKSRKLAIMCGGYKSHEQALLAGQRVKFGLLLSGAELQIGLDVGKDISDFWVHDDVKGNPEAQGYRVTEEIHGLAVYDESFPISFLSCGPVSAYSPISTETLITVLTRQVKNVLPMTDQLLLAAEIYGASFFEVSPRARFLSLVTAAEVLMQGKSRESIGKGLQKAALTHLPGKQYLHMSAEDFIKLCYSLRCGLVHSGKTKEGSPTIMSMVPELRRYISDLITKMAEKHEKTTSSTGDSEKLKIKENGKLDQSIRRGHRDAITKRGRFVD